MMMQHWVAYSPCSGPQKEARKKVTVEEMKAVLEVVEEEEMKEEGVEVVAA